MLFNSFKFLIFFPLTVGFYFVFPKRLKQHWLLLCSYIFYMGWSVRYALLLLFVTAVTYAGAILIEKFKKTFIFVLALCLVLSLLFYFKYLSWILLLICNFTSISVPEFSIILPVGISFFSFQAIGYLVDVKRGEISAERNFFTYTLFVSFFPQLVAGPIERSKNLLTQLKTPSSFNFDRVKHGFLLMLYGYFLKVVLADRAALLVDFVYANPESTGIQILAATFIFAFQIYGDFAGYSTIACGAAEILGIKLMDNFNCPYFSLSIKEFWRRWHISLSTWFRDYVYIPLGGNKKGTLRKNLNAAIVMLLSGLWHGAGLSYIVWGALHALAQIFDEATKTVRKKIPALIQMTVTFCYTCFTWLFFRAASLKAALSYLKTIIKNLEPSSLLAGNLKTIYGISEKECKFLVLSIFIFLVFDFCKYKGFSVDKKILSAKWYVQALVCSVTVCFIAVFGVWGSSYDASQFIYFQF